MHDRTVILLAIAAATFPCGHAEAAGGHYAVEDAALLDPGDCQLENWWARDPRNGVGLFHSGGSCRAGAVELGLGVERSHDEDAGLTSLQPEIKWAMALGERIAVGLYAGVAFEGGAERRGYHYVGSTLLVPLSWRASDAVRLQLNGGWICRVAPRGIRVREPPSNGRPRTGGC